MTKAFVELRSRTRRYKLNAADIGKLFKIVQRKTPSIPSYQEKHKILPETDDDTEAVSQIEL